MRCHLKTFRVLWLILALLMSLHCISCTDTADVPSGGGENNGESPSPDENTPSDGEQEKKVYTFDDATAEDFAISCSYKKTEYRRGETINLRGDFMNVSNSTYTYLGQNYLMVRMSVYYEKDGEVYNLKENPYEIPAQEPWECELAAGETTGASTRFVVQEDAPLGSYHIRVFYEDFEQIFENVLTIVE